MLPGQGDEPMQIPTSSGDTSPEILDLVISDPDLDFDEARTRAKEAAVQHCEAPPMMLAWHDTKTGTFYPTTQCGKSDDPPWVVYARARGANLTVSINQGEYVFLFLKL